VVEKVNLAEKLDLFDDHWSPRIVGELNGQYVKLAKLKGEFLWHRHEAEDEMFLIVRGQLVIKFRDRDVVLEAGEFLIVPRGVEHCPAAENECHVLLFEPVSTAHTGDMESERAVDQQAWI
jgi:mannose-6-phosphate isomerase-like protein (cupin superfamily)